MDKFNGYYKPHKKKEDFELLEDLFEDRKNKRNVLEKNFNIKDPYFKNILEVLAFEKNYEQYLLTRANWIKNSDIYNYLKDLDKENYLEKSLDDIIYRKNAAINIGTLGLTLGTGLYFLNKNQKKNQLKII